MKLTFEQVEALFAGRFDMPEDKAVAFRGILQNFQRLHFPTGINTGLGIHASYGWVQIIQLMVALDLERFPLRLTRWGIPFCASL